MEKFSITFLEKSDISESSKVLSEAMLNVPLHIAIFRLYPRFPIRENNVNPTYSEPGTIITVFENLQKSVQEDQRHRLRGKSYP